MANSSNQAPVTVEELLVSSLAQTDALAKLLIEKGIITQQEFLAKISEESDIRRCSSRQHSRADRFYRSMFSTSAEKSLMPLVSFPVILIYAMPVAIPFSTVAAVIATILFKILSLSRWRSSGRAAWICIGSTVGLILGGIFPFFLVLVGFGPDDPSWRFYWARVGAVAGTGCGFILGWVGGEKWSKGTHNKRLETDLRNRSPRSRASSAQPLR